MVSRDWTDAGIVVEREQQGGEPGGRNGAGLSKAACRQGAPDLMEEMWSGAATRELTAHGWTVAADGPSSASATASAQPVPSSSTPPLPDCRLLLFIRLSLPTFPPLSPSHSLLCRCTMPPRSPSRLVGQPLLYAISVFASLGVFLVSCLTEFAQQHGYLPANAECPSSSSSGTIKGKQPIACTFRACLDPRLTWCVNASVMSGVITGPHFRKYFNEPGPVEVGTMVAVLEIGAFGAFASHAKPNRAEF